MMGHDGTWWDMMGHDGTWWDMMGLGDMGLASSEKDVFMAWTQRERSFADARSTGSTAPFQCTKQVTAPSRIGSRNISDIYRNFYRYLNFCSHLHMSTSTFSLEWRGVLRCKTCPHVIGPASSHLWWGGTTALTMTPCCGWCWFWSSKYGSS